tara:strand:+ start:522 stop:860 length:339 start_codon:yes stop_codon:yes gene_type:complete
MINDYELLEHDEDYINDLNIINIDKNEYSNIIKNLLEKNRNLENENKKSIQNFIDINNKYLETLSDFNNLTVNYSQLENDLYDMELVNVELLELIKKMKITSYIIVIVFLSI